MLPIDLPKVSELIFGAFLQAIITALAVVITYRLAFRQARKGWRLQKLLAECGLTQTEISSTLARLYELRDKESQIPKGGMTHDEVDYIKREIEKLQKTLNGLIEESRDISNRMSDFEAAS